MMAAAAAVADVAAAATAAAVDLLKVQLSNTDDEQLKKIDVGCCYSNAQTHHTHTHTHTHH